MDLKSRIVEELAAGRARSLDLLDPLPPGDLLRQHSPLMSPLIWDLAHVGNYEDLWLLRAIGVDGVGPQYDDTYDAFRHPRRERPTLDLLDRDATRRYLLEVRHRAVDRLEGIALDEASPLLRDGFVYGMVVQHEHQHDETMLATLNLMGPPGYRPAVLSPPAARAAVPAEVLVDAGPFLMGTSDEPWAYDNERPAHVVELAAYWIDAGPVTNGQYAAFVAAGGYEEPAWWEPKGRAWRHEAGPEH